jgi:serralysin
MSEAVSRTNRIQTFTLTGDGYILSDFAKGGDDRIISGANATDQMWGDADFLMNSARGGNDTFVFNIGSGKDVINDFHQGNAVVGSAVTEHDVIDVQAYDFADWTALQAAITNDLSGNAVIPLSATDSVTLAGVHTADLHQSDFIIHA